MDFGGLWIAGVRKGCELCSAQQRCVVKVLTHATGVGPACWTGPAKDRAFLHGREAAKMRHV